MIIYDGIKRYENEWLATYILGYCHINEIQEYRRQIQEYSLFEVRTSDIHHRLAEKFIRKRYPTMAAWLQELKIPFGGYLDEEMGQLSILFVPKSIEEMSFRLCFNVQVGN